MADDRDRIRAALRGRYEVEREIGHGGMATVYLARDLRHDRQVAIKVLRPEIAVAVGAERFLREMGIAAQLQHPHILTLIDSGEAAGVVYYVMPYVDGESLRNRLVRHGPLSPGETARLLRDVVDAVAYAHSRGIVHRDIKPDNVLLSGRHALVVDFGIAKALNDAAGGATLTQTGVVVGTPAYMAPEQAAPNAPVDHRADVYSVGALAYELLCGHPPFEGPTSAVMAAHLVSTPVPIERARSETPAALAALVSRCLEKDPAKRFQSADELLDSLDRLITPSGLEGVGVEPTRARRWMIVAVAAVALLAISVTGYGTVTRLKRERWVHEVAIPEIRRRIAAADRDSVGAFLLAQRAAAAAPGDSALAALWPEMSEKRVIHTTPEGARVYWSSMADTGAWEPLGVTPTDSIRIPRAVIRLRLEKPGYRTRRLIAYTPFWSWFLPEFLLDSLTSPDSDMVTVPGGTYMVPQPGLTGAPAVELRPFRIDRHELTNQQFKRFVDAGGYRRREWWDSNMTKGGRRVPWDSAIATFVDRSGRPGPATWEGGEPPRGQEDLPVSGVSWYEAAAYARFAGKSLPTVYHWNAAALVFYAPWMLPTSNLNGTGPSRGSTSGGMSWMGVFDMAGNVREWCQNATGSKRYILGGGWTDPLYAFVDLEAQDPFDRSPINGIRLVRYAATDPNLPRAAASLERAGRDFARERPVGDAVFTSYARMYDYDRTALHVTVEERDSSAANWVRERVSFDAAYANERLVAYLYLPKRAARPLQAVVFFPGSGMIQAVANTNEMRELERTLSFEHVITGGRAVLFPVYKGILERSDSLRSDVADESIFYRDHVVMWVKDLRRSLDYLWSRSDVDTTRVGYFGASWGGYIAPIMLALEPRLKAAVLLVGGLEFERARPEVEPFNFLPRVTVPVVLLGSKYDSFYPVETSQRPFFEHLGTPPARKRWQVYEGDHFIARPDLIRETADWFDRYLGPVRR